MYYFLHNFSNLFVLLLKKKIVNFVVVLFQRRCSVQYTPNKPPTLPFQLAVGDNHFILLYSPQIRRKKEKKPKKEFHNFKSKQIKKQLLPKKRKNWVPFFFLFYFLFISNFLLCLFFIIFIKSLLASQASRIIPIKWIKTVVFFFT